MDVKPALPSTEAWRNVTVDELKASTENALATGPFGSSISSIFFQDSGVPVVRGGNLSENSEVRFNDEGLVFLSKEKATEFKRSIVRKGDLIFTCWGTVSQVGLIDENAKFEEYVISNKQMKFTPNPRKANSLFLYYLFSSSYFQKEIRNQSIGSSIPGFNLGLLRAIHFSIPDVLEQRAIAIALSDADAHISSLEQVIAKRRDIKQATMQELLTGKRRLLAFNREWEEKRLEDVFSIFVGASKSDQIIDGGRYWIVDMGSISIDGKLVVTKSTNFADDFLQCGDLVMPKDDIGGGNIIGKVGYVDIDTKYVLGDHVFALRSKQGNSLFYSYVINNYQINSAFRSKVKGSAQLGLSRKDVEEQKVPFPMIEEQTAIATVLSDMDAELAALERQRDKTKAIKQGMMQELLTGRIRLQ